MKNRTIKIFSAVLLGVMLVVILALTISASGTKNLANDADFSDAIVGTTSHGETLDVAAKTGVLTVAGTNDGNKYFKLYFENTSKTEDSYIGVKHHSNPGAGTTAILTDNLKSYKFITIDFDFMSETGSLPKMQFGPWIRILDANNKLSVVSNKFVGYINADANGNYRVYSSSGSTSTSKGVKLNQGAYAWNHVSYVLKIDSLNLKNSTYTLCVNGTELISGTVFTDSLPSSADGYYLSNDSLIVFDQLRIQTVAGQTPNSSMNFCMDNIKLYTYSKDYSASSPDSVWSSDYKFPLGESVARVDGEYYSTTSAALSAMASAKEEIEIFQNFANTITVNSPITVKTNGHTFNYKSTKNYIPDVTDEGTKDEVLKFRNTRYVYWHVADKVYTESYVYGEMPSFKENYPDAVEIDNLTYNTLGGWADSDLGNKVNISAATSDIHYYIERENIARYFSVTSADGKTVTEYNSERGNSPEDIITAVANLKDGETLTLISNIIISKSITLPKNVTLYFDLAGRDLVLTSHDSKKAQKETFSVNNGTTFNVYSSLPGGEIYNSFYYYYYSNEKLKTQLCGQAIFRAGNISNSTINIGEITKDGVTYSGDNLSTYSSNIVYYAGSGTNNKININGGSYYRAINDNRAFFCIYNQLDVTINNALIASTSDGDLFAAYDNKEGAGNFNIILNNSVIYTAGNLFNHMKPASYIEFNDCYIFSNINQSNVASYGTVKIGDGTYLANVADLTANPTFDGVMAKTYVPYRLVLDKVSFNYIYDSESAGVNSTYNHAQTSKKTQTEVLFAAKYVVCSEGKYETVNWKYAGETVTEYYREGMLPICPFDVPVSSSAYTQYTADKKIETTVGGRTSTYEIAERVVMDIYNNITLDDSFIYNVYIPKAAKSSINSVKISGNTVNLDTLSTQTINGEVFYKISFPVLASKGALDYALTLNVKGESGNLEDAYTLSIPKYASGIIDADYDEKTDALMTRALAYIKAASNYFGTDSSSITGITNASAFAGEKMGAVPTAIASVFSGAQLMLDGRINFRFNIKDSVESFTASFTYYDKGEANTVTKTLADAKSDALGRYIEIPVAARYMLTPIVITVNGASFSYSFDNYLYNANNSATISKNQNLITLLYNMRAYGAAAENYVRTTPIVNMTIAGNSISEYTIVANTAEEILAANAIKDRISEVFGVNLSVKNAASGKAIYVRCTGYTSPVDFKVSVLDGNMYVDSAYLSFMEGGAREFINEYFVNLEKSVDFANGFVDVYATDHFNYRDFGAVGDGVTDDFNAIYVAHTFANAKQYNVVANDGIYNVGQHSNEIPVKTNVDWTGATFLIDDSTIDPSNAARTRHIFAFKSDYNVVKYDKNSTLVKSLASGFKHTVTNIGFAPGYRALVVFRDANNYAYNRFGTHATATPPAQAEFTVVEANGDIISGNEFLLDFNGVTGIEVYRADDKPITAIGGTFRTIANQAPPVYTSYARGFLINRSNTVIKNTVHTIEGEGKTGAPYGGFITTQYAYNSLYENLTLQGHKAYQDYKEDGSVNSTMGTYDIGGSYASGIYFKNCKQSNFFKDEATLTTYPEKEYWGIMGTNHCKNMTYDGCRLSRLDAHAGVYNVTIKDTEICWIKLTGGGTATIENVKVYNDSRFIELRSDYGSTWKGDIIIKNCEFYNPGFNTQNTQFLIAATWNNWDFGNYTVTLPNVTIDNLMMSKANSTVYVFQTYSTDQIDKATLKDGSVNKNIADIDATIRIRNNKKGYNYATTPSSYISPKMSLIKE